MQASPVIGEDNIPGAYWQWRGHSIYYVQGGQQHSDRPPLLLVHGFGASTDHWRKNIAQLKEDFRVWAIDLLGFGRSAKPTPKVPLLGGGKGVGNLWRDQLQDFITTVIGEPVVLGGNSLGGYASLCVAAQCSQSVVGLVLLNSAGPFTESTAPKSNFGNKIVRWVFLQPWASYLLFQYLRRKKTIRKTLEKVYWDRTAVTDRLVEEIYRPSCDKGALQVFASVFQTPQGEKVDVLLQQLNCPLLMLWGEKDPWMNVTERSPKFRHHYPSLTEHYLEAGHCPHDEVPEQVNGLIRSWVLSNIAVSSYQLPVSEYHDQY